MTPRPQCQVKGCTNKQIEHFVGCSNHMKLFWKQQWDDTYGNGIGWPDWAHIAPAVKQDSVKPPRHTDDVVGGTEDDDVSRGEVPAEEKVLKAIADLATQVKAIRLELEMMQTPSEDD